MKIYHILNSDFGLKSTMGYRAFQIAIYSEHTITVSARANCSASEVRFKGIFPGYRLYARMVQVLRQKGYPCTRLKAIENRLFERVVDRNISGHDIAHFFCFYPNLIRKARALGVVTVAEGFTHPSCLAYLYRQGFPWDSDIFCPDADMVKCYELVDYIISPSRWVTQCLLEAKIPAAKIVEIYYGVHPQPERRYEQQGERIRFMFAGGLKTSKGLNDLLNCWRILGDRYSDKVELHLYGRIYNRTENILKQAVSQCGNIVYHGFVKNMADEYRRNDVYIYPTYYEGSSKTVFEAMSFGLPVITTPNAGSIISDNVDGYIVEIHDVPALVESVILLMDRGRIQKMGRLAQEHSRHFTWQGYAENVNNFYRQIGTKKNHEADLYYQYQSC